MDRALPIFSIMKKLWSAPAKPLFLFDLPLSFLLRPTEQTISCLARPSRWQQAAKFNSWFLCSRPQLGVCKLPLRIYREQIIPLYRN